MDGKLVQNGEVCARDELSSWKARHWPHELAASIYLAEAACLLGCFLAGLPACLPARGFQPEMARASCWECGENQGSKSKEHGPSRPLTSCRDDIRQEHETSHGFFMRGCPS